MRLLPLIAIISSFNITAYGQSVGDSAIIEREQAAFRLTNTYPDSALAIAVKDLKESLLTNNKSAAAYSYKTKGWSLFRLGNADSCLSNLVISTDLFRQLHDT